MPFPGEFWWQWRSLLPPSTCFTILYHHLIFFLIIQVHLRSLSLHNIFCTPSPITLLFSTSALESSWNSSIVIIPVRSAMSFSSWCFAQCMTLSASLTILSTSSQACLSLIPVSSQAFCFSSLQAFSSASSLTCWVTFSMSHLAHDSQLSLASASMVLVTSLTIVLMVA